MSMAQMSHHLPVTIFGNYDSAQKFAKEHNGKRVLAFAEIPEALINLLNGKI
jgi:nitrous oxide reductase accessory protein NosL